MKVFTVARGIPDKDYPQNGIFEYDQAKALAVAGAHVTVLALDMRPWNVSRKHGLACFDTEHGIHVVRLSLPTGAYRKGMPILQFLIRVMYRKAVSLYGKPDVIHAHFYFLGAIASTLKSRFGVPLVLTEHSSKMNCPLSSISPLDRAIAERAYRNADRVISVSSALAGRLNDNFGIKAPVISNVADVSNFGYHARQYDGQSSESVFRFVSVGNLIPLKHFHVLLDAFALAFPSDGRVLLTIVGGGPESHNLRKKAHELGISKHVCFTGAVPRDRVRDEMYAAHAFVLASSTETFGLVYAEAMATGLPVIATECGGPQDFVNEYNGILVPVGDVRKLADALERMKNSAGWFDGREISEGIIRRFSEKTIGEQVLDVMAQAVGDHL